MDLSARPSYVEPSAAEAIDNARKFIDECRALTSHLPAHEHLVQPAITPRFVPACTRNLLSQLGDLASETSTMVQSHLAEAKDQLEFVKRNHGIDDIDIFAQVVSSLLTLDSIQANGLYLERATHSTNSSGALHLSLTFITHTPSFFGYRDCPLSSVKCLFFLATFSST
jgi:guanine deaminase